MRIDDEEEINRMGEKRFKEFLENLEKEAQRGNEKAAFHLAELYQEGLGVEPNIIKAIKYYRIAAIKNHEDANKQLALIYMVGEDVYPQIERDDNKAKKYIEKVRLIKEKKRLKMVNYFNYFNYLFIYFY